MSNLSPEPEEVATCRGCGMVLDGKPYYTGRPAFHPHTKEQVLSCAYGGWVCSEWCDRRAALDLEGTMPGCGGIKSPMIYQDREAFERKWKGMKCR